MTNHYDASSIRVLEGLEPVKMRPGMYTRTQDPTHIIQEVLDNASDECLGGFATKIWVTYHLDHSITIEDNGRGIPVDTHKDTKKPAIEVIFTKLHSGGKFNKTDGEASYKFSGGLHGVGVSVTNALSDELKVDVFKNQKSYQIVFSNGDVVSQLKETGVTEKQGTKVHIKPNPKYFDSPKVDLNLLKILMKSKAFLMPGVEVFFEDETKQEKLSWCFEDGLASCLSSMTENEELVCIPFLGEKFVQAEDINDNFPYEKGEGATWACAWTLNTGKGESYVNLIPTLSGGTHETGLRAGLYEGIKSFIEHHSLMPKGLKIQAEDVWGRLKYILSAKVLDPQFQGQTKDRLNNQSTYKLLTLFVKNQFEMWLNNNLDEAKKLSEFIIQQAQSRQKNNVQLERKKTTSVAVLPGKLTDCSAIGLSRDDLELFLVEGDSAAGGMKESRLKNSQAILPLRGKVLNTFEVNRVDLFNNNEVEDISISLGILPHSIDDNVDLSNLRYGKVIIAADADIDGGHIQVLLLTLFYKHFPKLIQNGIIHVANPPLFRIDVLAGGKKGFKMHYVQDETEKSILLKKLEKEGIKPHQIQVSRFKGLGEMNSDQLKDTLLNPETRKLSCITLEDQEKTEALFKLLMAKNESPSRKTWMELNGHKADLDI